MGKLFMGFDELDAIILAPCGENNVCAVAEAYKQKQVPVFLPHAGDSHPLSRSFGLQVRGVPREHVVPEEKFLSKSRFETPHLSTNLYSGMLFAVAEAYEWNCHKIGIFAPRYQDVYCLKIARRMLPGRFRAYGRADSRRVSTPSDWTRIRTWFNTRGCKHSFAAYKEFLQRHPEAV